MADFLSPNPNPYVDGASVAFLQAISTLLGGKQLSDVSLAEAREAFREAQASQSTPSDIKVSHQKIATSHGAVKTSIYRPAATIHDSVPVIFYVHGGGWILGDIFDFQPIIYDLVERTQCAVVFPQYTLAPEAKFPTQQEQCLEVLQDIAKKQHELHLDLQKIAIVADSAGCQIAVAISILNHQCRLSLPIVHQVLLHPLIDTTSLTSRFSQYEFQNGPFVTSSFIKEAITNYFPDPSKDVFDITASPILMTSKQVKTFMPSSTIVTAQTDWLRGQGQDFAKLLQTSGVECGAIDAFASLHDAAAFTSLLTASPTIKLVMTAVAGKLQKVLKQEGAKGSKKRARVGKSDL